MTNKPWVLILVLTAYMGLSLLFHHATPPMEASDEAGHAAFVFYLKTHHALPVCIPGHPLGPGPQEFTQAPLYYLLGACLIAPIDTSNAEDFFTLRPQAPIGRADIPGPKNGWEIKGNRNFPFVQTRLAVIILRLFSMALGVGTLLFVYRMVRLFWALDPTRDLLALSWIAFNPMFLFISNAINNDNLIMLCASATLYYLFLARETDARPRADLLAGLWLGFAILAKASGCLLIPVAIIAYVSSPRHPSVRRRGLGLCLVTGLLVAAPWLIWNAAHYGDPLGIGIHQAFAHLRPIPETWALLHEWDGFIKSYWGVFGMFNVIYPQYVYTGFFVLTALSVGLVGYALVIRRWSGAIPWILAVFSLLVLLSVASWTRTVWASQGRLLFPALSAHALLVVGSIQVLPQNLRRTLSMAIPVVLFLTALWAAWHIIPQSYS